MDKQKRKEKLFRELLRDVMSINKEVKNSDCGGNHKHKN
jgi:hypothetical protein